MNSIPFALEHAYFMDVGFRFDNMAQAGPRSRIASKRHLSEAARLIEPVLDKESPLAGHLRSVMQHMGSIGTWRPLTPVLFNEELTRLQMEKLRIQAGEKALVSNAYMK